MLRMTASKSYGANIFMLSFLCCLLANSAVSGCGLIPFGQAKTLRFNVNGLKLGLPMAYTGHAGSRSSHPTVSENDMAAQTFIRNLVMRTVSDVLEQQGRSAGLPDAVTSAILDQLTINVTYMPLKCDSVSTLAEQNLRTAAMDNCLVVSDTVTSICTMMTMQDCGMAMHLKAIPQQHTMISGTITTTNIIMAGWTDQMWTTILNRALRSLSSGAFGTIFLAATVTIT